MMLENRTDAYSFNSHFACQPNCEDVNGTLLAARLSISQHGDQSGDVLKGGVCSAVARAHA